MDDLLSAQKSPVHPVVGTLLLHILILKELKLHHTFNHIMSKVHNENESLQAERLPNYIISTYFTFNLSHTFLSCCSVRFGPRLWALKWLVILAHAILFSKRTLPSVFLYWRIFSSAITPYEKVLLGRRNGADSCWGESTFRLHGVPARIRLIYLQERCR